MRINPGAFETTRFISKDGLILINYDTSRKNLVMFRSLNNPNQQVFLILDLTLTPFLEGPTIQPKKQIIFWQLIKNMLNCYKELKFCMKSMSN